MGRAASGYQLRWRSERGWTVRFRHEGQRQELATGIKDKRARADAERAGRALFTAALRGERQQRRSAPTGREPLREVAAQWLSSIGVRPATLDLYRDFAEQWLRQWQTIGELTAPAIDLYAQRRLRAVQGVTVTKELSAMRVMLRWAVAAGHIQAVPEIPSVTHAQGTKHAVRRRARAPEYTPAEIWAVINALPERAPRLGIPLRARAIVSYLTTLRPSTIARLSVPEHYSRGAGVIRVSSDIDKEGMEREVPLPTRAQRELDAVCPERGLIFGDHDLDRYWHAAARVLPPHKARVFTAQHFRSAGITHALERSANLAGVQYLAGHRRAATTSRYVRASFRAAAEVAAIWGTDAGDEPAPDSESAEKAG